MEEKDENLVEELKKLQNELKEYKDAYLRKNAEFNTFVTRKKEELEREKKNVLEKFLLKILEIKSELDLSFEHQDNSESFVQGIKMISSKLESLLSEEGVEEIETAISFNPEFHDGVAAGNVEEKEDGEILQVFSKGYKLNGKVIMASKVMVNKKNINKGEKND
jgi:grpE